MARDEPAAPEETPRPGLAAVLVLLAVVSTGIASLGTPLLPTVQRVERVSLDESQWALTITLLVGAVATPVIGRLGAGRARRATTLGTVAAMVAGCVVSALPLGFGTFLLGRGIQGAGLGLVPLATAIARDHLPPHRRVGLIALIGVTTAAGVGIGYPLVGLLAGWAGLAAPFWFVAALGAGCLAAAVVVLPRSPGEPVRVDVLSAALLGGGIAGLLLVLAQGPTWGWTTDGTVLLGVASVALLAAWVVWELHIRHPLVDLRLLRHRPVLAANLSVFAVAVGFYPLLSLVVRLVQTPPSAGYGFGASVVVAGLMLTPFSLASFAASRVVRRVLGRLSAEAVVAAGCVLLIGSMVLFWAARSTYWELVVAMAVDGFGVGCVYAVNPIQISHGVPAIQTSSAMSLYQVGRTVAYSIGSALSATILIQAIPPGGRTPTAAGYSTAAATSTVALLVALGVSLVFAVRPGRRRGSRLPDRATVGG